MIKIYLNFIKKTLIYPIPAHPQKRALATLAPALPNQLSLSLTR